MIEPPRITPENRQHYLELAQQARQLQADRADPTEWMSRNLLIRTKTRSIVPLRPNSVQRDYFAHRTQWDILLKARQVGITTGVSALFFADTVLTPNTTSVMLAHNLDSTEQIFGIVRLFWERLPEEEKAIIGKPRYASRRELYWPDLNSRFLVGTAGSTRFGRGFTVNNLHCSEFAIWPSPEEALLAAMEAVPQDGRIAIESTANGVGNALYDRWVEAVEGRSRFAPRYYTWFEHPEYALAGPPLGELTEEETKLQERWQLTDSQLRWRRQKQADLGGKFDQEYPSDWVTAFLASGRCVFDTQKLRAIQARIAAEPGPSSLSNLLLPSGEPVTVAPATLLVWRRPEAGHRYVVGADVGEGLEDGDASCAVVLDHQSGEQAAELHGRVPPARFGAILDALGRYYHLAEIAVERNNHGHSTLNTLYTQLRYPRLYDHFAYDSGAGRRREVRLGWPTTPVTKPILVDDLIDAVNNGHLTIHSQGLVAECYTFILDEKGNAHAQEGKHDDRVLAAGIAWQIRKIPERRWSSERPPGM